MNNQHQKFRMEDVNEMASQFNVSLSIRKSLAGNILEITDVDGNVCECMIQHGGRLIGSVRHATPRAKKAYAQIAEQVAILFHFNIECVDGRIQFAK